MVHNDRSRGCAKEAQKRQCHKIIQSQHIFAKVLNSNKNDVNIFSNFADS